MCVWNHNPATVCENGSSSILKYMYDQKYILGFIYISDILISAFFDDVALVGDINRIWFHQLLLLQGELVWVSILLAQ